MKEVKEQTSIGAIKVSQEKGKSKKISHPVWFSIVRYCPEQIG